MLADINLTWHHRGVKDKSCHISTAHDVVFLTFFGQHGDADTRVTELDEGQAACLTILLPDQKNILGANISMDEVLILL